jgi:phosphatidate cytidylyltransferase
MSRIATGLGLILVGGFVLIKGGLPLALFLVVVGCLAFYEVQQMTELKSWGLMALNMVAYTACILFVLWLNVWVTFVIIGGAFVIFITEFKRKALVFRSNLFLNNLKFFLYITLGFWSVFYIRSMDEQFFVTLGLVFMFVAIWATDVFAYYGGKLFGKHPLSPISPKKTIEGTVIGIAAAMVFSSLSLYIIAILPYSNEVQLNFFVIPALVAGLIGAIAQFGDLYESLIKRTYNVKDSSNLLPGHGGILDRADSTLFVAPIMAVFLEILMGILP